MDFVEWCGLVLKAIVEVTQASPQERLSGINEISLAQAIFGEERRTQPDFWESTQRHGMLDAVAELQRNNLIRDRGHRFYLPDPAAREILKNPKSLWEQICLLAELGGEHLQLLKAVNLLSQKSAADHAWLESVDNEPLLAELHWPEGDESRDLLWAVSQELEQFGFVKRNPYMGGKIELTSTYRGLVWDTKRRLLQKCDVFISHATEESALAVSLKEFLMLAFGEDCRIFVSSDYRSIGGGKLWFVELLEALKSAPVVLVLLSESSVGRRWINFEAGIGIGAGSLVIPLVTPGFQKGEVGHPLSALQVRSLADDKDVEGMLDDIAGRTNRNYSEVEAAKFVAAGSAAGGSKLEATLHQVTERVYDGYEEHALRVGLVNNSAKTLSDYRIEVEVPNTFLNQSTGYQAEVENRRTAEYRVFRMEGKDSSVKTLRPGDKAPSFLKVTLVIPPKAEENNALDKMVVTKVFASDVMTQKIEKTVREILEMTPSFG